MDLSLYNKSLKWNTINGSQNKSETVDNAIYRYKFNYKCAVKCIVLNF